MFHYWLARTDFSWWHVLKLNDFSLRTQAMCFSIFFGQIEKMSVAVNGGLK